VGDQLKRILASLTSRWNAMGPGQKFVTGSLLATALVTILVTAFLARHATYAVLYAGLDPEQANAVVEELRDMKVRHRLKDGGRTILVPEKDVYSARIDLAGQGLPGGGGVGFEIFDKRGFGMTNFMQQVNYRRALEGELTRTIAEMDEVLGARVHLVMPERTLFMDEDRQPSASVMLRLKPGARLGRKQAEGIGYLVAGSVEGLSADHVNILDFYGNLISGHDMASLEGEGTARMEVKASVERWLEDKAQSLLDRVVGPGNAVVRVTAELDFERVERNVEMYDPENAVVRSEEMSEESQGDGGGEFLNTVTNYEINRTVETLVKAPGTVERLTVAVTVDGRYEVPEGAGEDSEAQFVPLPQAELDELAAIVKNAVGHDDRRGDQFHIACVQFNHQYLDREQQEMKRVERQMLIQTIVRYGFLLVAAAAAFLILRKIFRSISGTLAELPRPAPEGTGGAVAGEGPASEDAAAVTRLVDQVSDAARRQPQESAALIRNMITESE
jgi:flagellar M-ring protein FliF